MRWLDLWRFVVMFNLSDWRKLWIPAHHSDQCRPARHGGGGGHHWDYQVRDTGRFGWMMNILSVLINNIIRLMTTAATFKSRTRVSSTRMVWTWRKWSLLRLVIQLVSNYIVSSMFIFSQVMSSHWTWSKRKATGRFLFYLKAQSLSSVNSATRTLWLPRLMFTTGKKL